MADEQSRAAAERSADVVRGGEPTGYRDRCVVCQGPWAKGGASHAVRVGPPFMEVCSAACAALPPFRAAPVTP